MHAQLSACFVKKTRQCLGGYFSEDQIDYAVNKTALFLKQTGSPQWYCSNKPTNMSSLDPDLRQHFPCSDKLFAEGYKCTKDFREIFNTNRSDPRLCGWVFFIGNLMRHVRGWDTLCVTVLHSLARTRKKIVFFFTKSSDFHLHSVVETVRVLRSSRVCLTYNIIFMCLFVCLFMIKIMW